MTLECVKRNGRINIETIRNITVNVKYGEQSDDQGQRAFNQAMASDSDGVIGISARLTIHGAKDTIRKKTRQLFPESSFFDVGSFGTDHLPVSAFNMAD